MKSYGIERQTLLVSLIPVLVMAVLMKSHDIYTRFGDMDKAMIERSKLLALQLASSCEYAVLSGNISLLKKEVDSAFIRQDVVGVAVLDESRQLLAGGGRAAVNADLLKKIGPEIPLYQDDDMLLLYEPIIATPIDLDEADFDRASMSFTPAAKPLGAVVIQISKLHLSNQKKEVLLFSSLATLLILAVTFLVALWAARRITFPIMDMTRAVGDIGSGALDTRVPSRSGIYELNDLAAGINQMAERLKLDRETLENRIAEATTELRIKKEEAENASRDKSRFLAAASHDLRQPIHALGLFIGQLRNKVTTPEQIRIVAQIEESADAFLDLLSGLLDISKLDAGIVLPQLRPFHISMLLNRIAQEYDPVARDKDIQFRVRSTSAEVLSDPMLLERILFNLLSNALRYTPQHGRVLVVCRRRGDNLRIEVRDNGIGIPQADQKDIFREFVQLSNAERDRGKGLGLGLAIVERLSRLLYHPISLRSMPGKGSVFAVDVPLKTAVADSADRLQENSPIVEQRDSHGEIAPANLEGTSVLLVDDDELVRTSTAGMLREWGCEVLAAASLQEAREHYSGQEFDLLICDYRLPDGTGLEVIDWIESACKRHVPAILISGDTALEVLQKVSANECHLLHKPVRPAKLRSLALFLLAERDALPGEVDEKKTENRS
jgi:two-component system, sensor histidine kinase